MSIEVPSPSNPEEPEESILMKEIRSSLFWGMPLSDYGRGSSWPECGAIPPTNSAENDTEINEDTRRAMAFSHEHGLVYFDRLEDESFEDFRARINTTMDTPPVVSEI